MSATEITAHDIETAIKIGLAQLNLLRAEVKIEVLDEGSKGVLGIGSRPARVRLTPYSELPTAEAPASPTTTPAPSVPAASSAAASTQTAASAAVAPPAPTPAPPQETSAPTTTPINEPAPQPPVAQEEASATTDVTQVATAEGETAAPATQKGITEESVQLAATLTQGVLDRMEMQVTCTSKLVEPHDEDDSPSIWVDVQGRDASRLLAHQSEALEALQLVVQTMWAHQTKSNLRLTLDADSYKERRTKHLQQMAERLAERVVSSGRSITLEPMSASERRLVHIALRDHPQVTTESHGEGSARRVTIRLK